ncbi:heme ABC transporter ATP-binding protein [Candidatus Sororendozoicomonas aggregata]|uniref:heme ABC transporter ATP-binding protein n=1 Tax=Candidatus Sororendozoicomonas aggregata TaxID=3073239 RepID=UPI002ED4253C
MSATEHTLELSNIGVHIGGKKLLDDISLSVRPGEVISVLGPNGAGKSTLMKTITGDRVPCSGHVSLNGRSDWGADQKALMVGVLPQSSSLSFPFTVEEVVLLGRIPCATDHRQNQETTRQALEKVDCLHLRDRLYTTLSGGEKQRVHMARVLCQIWDECPLGPRYLLLDEPTSALDPAHQQHALQVVREQADAGMGVFVILHDLNLAARYSDRIIVLKQGKMAALGTPFEVLTPKTVQEVFDIDVDVLKHPSRPCPLVINT